MPCTKKACLCEKMFFLINLCCTYTGVHHKKIYTCQWFEKFRQPSILLVYRETKNQRKQIPSCCLVHFFPQTQRYHKLNRTLDTEVTKLIKCESWLIETKKVKNQTNSGHAVELVWGIQFSIFSFYVSKK